MGLIAPPEPEPQQGRTPGKRTPKAESRSSDDPPRGQDSISLAACLPSLKSVISCVLKAEHRPWRRPRNRSGPNVRNAWTSIESPVGSLAVEFKPRPHQRAKSNAVHGRTIMRNITLLALLISLAYPAL